jgi:hypothetical protein
MEPTWQQELKRIVELRNRLAELVDLDSLLGLDEAVYALATLPVPRWWITTITMRSNAWTDSALRRVERAMAIAPAEARAHRAAHRQTARRAPGLTRTVPAIELSTADGRQGVAPVRSRLDWEHGRLKTAIWRNSTSPGIAGHA